jgi:signal transduction histidine kinase/ActR/RegA family two-component response regulator
MLARAASALVLRCTLALAALPAMAAEAPRVALPDLLRAARRGDDVEADYRFALDLPAGVNGWAIYLPGALGHVRLAINGHVLLDTIASATSRKPSIQMLHLLDLPPHLLRERENDVRITLRRINVVSLSRVVIGAQEPVRDAKFTKLALLVYGPMIVSALIGCLGLSVLLIWLRRSGEALYGYFGVASIAWGVHTAWTVTEWGDGVAAQVAWTTLYAFLVCMLVVFCLRFAGYRLPRLEPVVRLAWLGVAALLALAAALDRFEAVDAAVRLAMVAGALATLAAVARRAWRVRSFDSALLVAAGLVAAGFGLRDWIVSEVRNDFFPVLLTPYAGLPFVALMAWLLIDRFVRATEGLEVLNRELEQRVQAQSAELRNALDHMRAAKEGAEKANRSKTGFLAAASHDLRQPIHALGLYMGALRHRTADPASSEIVERMDSAVGALDSLLDSLLDISRIDAGALVPRPAAFDLAALLLRLGDEFAPDAALRGLRLSTRIGGDGRARAWSDPLLVERLLRNLIANAVKYTRRGGVLVTCRARHDATGAALWCVEVWDTGPGIAPEERERVFEEFYQAGNPERDRRAGLGLGLSIVRRLAQLLGLALELHSVPGRGTRFVVVLPATEVQEHGADEPVEAPALRRLRVAVIEDDAEVRAAMRTLLAGWGCDVHDAADADELLRRRHAAAPQALVVDLRLRGGRDGISEAQRVRAAFGAALPVLVVSGDTAPERVRLMESSGLPWLAKPVAAARLRAWLAQVHHACEGPAHAQIPQP